MRDAVRIVRDRQLFVRREMQRRGIALKQVELDSGLPHPTLLSYFPAEGSRDPAVLPASALFALLATRALPLDLLNLLLPEGLALVAVPDDVDHDAAAQAMQAYLIGKGQAHRPDSPDGPAIAPCEDAQLRGALAAVPVVRQ
jgi:hypothetical protein